MRGRALVVLIAAAALVGGPNTAFACSCAQRTPDLHANDATLETPGVGGTLIVTAN